MKEIIMAVRCPNIVLFEYFLYGELDFSTFSRCFIWRIISSCHRMVFSGVGIAAHLLLNAKPESDINDIFKKISPGLRRAFILQSSIHQFTLHSAYSNNSYEVGIVPSYPKQTKV